MCANSQSVGEIADFWERLCFAESINLTHTVGFVVALLVHCDATGMRIVAAILAGGVGMRVRTLLPNLPKALAPIDGTPFISYLLDQVAEAGVERIVVCSGRRGDQLRRGLPRRRSGIPVVVSQEEWPMGTAGALRKAIEHFDADTVLALNGDSYVDTNLAEFCQCRQSGRFESSVLLTPSANCVGQESVEVDATGRISAFRSKTELPQPGWVDGGVYLFPRAWIEGLPAWIPLSLERDVLPYWIERGLGGFCTHAPFLDIGTVQGLADAPDFFASVRRRKAPKFAAGLCFI